MNYQSIPLIGSALLLSTLSANGQKKNTQPNILFILCDDMGYGDLGCYGQPFIRTPHIDAMAGEGMRFTQAYAGSPVSAPSRASFMTGQHSGHCEVRGNKEYWKNAPIVEYGQNKEYSIVGQHPYDPDHVILPEIMKDNGYTTGMFGKWAGGYEGSCSTPDKRGIDEYYGYICQFQAHLYYPNFLNRYSKALGDTGVVRIVMDENIKYPMYGPEYQKRSQYSADMIHEKAMEWLDQQDTKQPFFGIFTYTLPHAELVGVLIVENGNGKSAEAHINRSLELESCSYGCLCLNIIGRVDDSHSGDSSHKCDILVALVGSAVLAYGDTCVGSTDLDIKVGISDRVSYDLKSTSCRKHCEGACKYLLACGSDTCCNAHHVSLGNTAVEKSFGAGFLENACLCSRSKVGIENDKIGIYAAQLSKSLAVAFSCSLFNYICHCFSPPVSLTER